MALPPLKPRHIDITGFGNDSEPQKERRRLWEHGLKSRILFTLSSVTRQCSRTSSIVRIFVGSSAEKFVGLLLPIAAQTQCRSIPLRYHPPHFKPSMAILRTLCSSNGSTDISRAGDFQKIRQTTLTFDTGFWYNVSVFALGGESLAEYNGDFCVWLGNWRRPRERR